MEKGVDSELGPLSDAINQDKLLIFSSGNEGETVSAYEICAPLFKKETANNIINVTAALNSFDGTNHLERNSDGSISGDFINAPFSILPNIQKNTLFVHLDGIFGLLHPAIRILMFQKAEHQWQLLSLLAVLLLFNRLFHI